mmetsp:Transcript_66726/g.157126  ORF Transcript_66726/g.157126 Transcript_66726/m.157126 type:complete len:357 (-) Transcript_66726:26-1096(-)
MAYPVGRVWRGGKPDSSDQRSAASVHVQPASSSEIRSEGQRRTSAYPVASAAASSSDSAVQRRSDGSKSTSSWRSERTARAVQNVTAQNGKSMATSATSVGSEPRLAEPLARPGPLGRQGHGRHELHNSPSPEVNQASSTSSSVAGRTSGRARRTLADPAVDPLSGRLSSDLQQWGVPTAPLNVEQAASDVEEWPESANTVTIQNIPCRCRTQEILDSIRALGFGDDELLYFHLPLKQGKSSCNLGYCFVGFRSPELAREFYRKSRSFKFPSRHSKKVIQVEAAKQAFNDTGTPFQMHGEVIWFTTEGTATTAGHSATMTSSAAERSAFQRQASPQGSAEFQAMHSKTPHRVSWLL